MSPKKCKKNPKSPRLYRMNRQQRLSSARNTGWVSNDYGNKIIKAYKKKYGVDILCAITELKILGVKIDQTYENQIRQSRQANASTKNKKKLRKEEANQYSYSDDTFAYIAGYTSGGVPFGITWDEMDHELPYIKENDEIE